VSKSKHNDCLNFSPVDASKGICRITGSMINIDSEVCSKFDLAPKCRNCEYFKKPDKDEIGICLGLNKEDWTFGDLNAITCKGHKFK
jgi:4-hydroxyphenylacetate decarboxylase small subunit